MKNDVALFKSAGLPSLDLAQFKKALAIASDSIQIGGSAFLKLDKRDGEWRYGAEDTDVQPGSLWAVNPHSFAKGFIAWKKSEVLGKVMRAITNPSGPVMQSELPNVAAEWQEVWGMKLRCMNGDDAGTEVEYESTSYGAKKAFKGLLEAFGDQMAKNPTNIVPVVEMKSDSYEHKEWGTIYNPIFEIKKWIPLSDEAPTGADLEVETAVEDAPKEVAKPVVRQRRRATV